MGLLQCQKKKNVILDWCLIFLKDLVLLFTKIK
jgi:hypothetical protein